MTAALALMLALPLTASAAAAVVPPPAQPPAPSMHQVAIELLPVSLPLEGESVPPELPSVPDVRSADTTVGGCSCQW